MARVHARWARPAVLALALALCASLTRADIIVITNEYTLAEVMAMPGGLRVYDKVFTDWDLTDTSKNGGNPPDATSIKVVGIWVDYNNDNIKDLGDEFGVRFTAGWSAFGTQIVETAIDFKVTPDNPYQITDNTLWMKNGAGGNGGQASVTERVFDTNMPAEPIATKYAWHNELNDQALAHVDYGSAYDYLYLSLNVIANGGVSQTPLGSASVGVFDVTFSQIPEPGAIALMLLGSAGLLIRRRRR